MADRSRPALRRHDGLAAAHPVVPVPPVADYASSLQAALLILAALVGRDGGRTGVYLDVAIADAVLAWQGVVLASVAQAPRSCDRGTGDESGGAASYNLYETRDARFMTLAAQEPKFWRAFCEAVRAA